MKSKIKRRKVKRGTAVNRRDVVYEYHPIDDVHSIALRAGRCKRCSTITTLYCIECHKPFCKNHLDKDKRCKSCCAALPKAIYIG